MLSASGGFILAFSVAALYVLRQLYAHPLAAYPGPFLAKLTNLWRLVTFSKGAQHLVDYDLHQRYGPIVRDGPSSLLIADVDIFKSIYSFNNNAIEKGDFYLSSSNNIPGDTNVFSAKTETLHRQAKGKLVPPALSPKRLMQYEPFVTRNIELHISKLGEQIRKGGGQVDITSGNERLTFDAMLETSYGSSMGYIEAGFDKHGTLAEKETIFGKSIGIGLVPILARILATKLVNTLLRKPKLDENGAPKGVTAPFMWSEDIVERATHGDHSPQPSILRSPFEIDESDKHTSSIPWIRHECYNVVFAGTGSTASGLNAVLYEIGTHPAWQARLYAEISKLPQSDDLSNASLLGLPQLQAVVKEALRLHPPFGGPFERTVGGTSGQTVIAGMEAPLPKGTRVWSTAYVICRSPEVFGPDAEELRPERWLESEPARIKDMEDTFFVFGRGSRGCIGKDLAWMIIQKTVVSILRRWSIECAPGTLRPWNAFEMQYKNLQMTFTERN